MTSRPLYVLGAGGLAREAAQLAFEVDGGRRWDFRGYIGSEDEVGRHLSLGNVVGTDEWLLAGDEPADLIVGLGSPKLRAKVLEPYVEKSGLFAFPVVVHPSARLEPQHVELGRGTLVTAGCTFTIDIAVGDFNYFNLHTTIGHDVVVGRSCVLNPSVNVSGGTHVGDRVLVGTGAQILEGRSIGDDATVGAGAVVTKDVEPGATVVGIPAKPLA